MNLPVAAVRSAGISIRATLVYLAVVAVAMFPIWNVKYFVPQDGIAHVYNAYLINELIDGNQVFSSYLSLNSFAVPNSTGHWLLVILLRLFSPFISLKILATITFAGFVASIAWLRSRSGADPRGSEIIILLGATLAFNWMWFVGFYNFTIGVIGFVCCLALYLSWRDSMRWWRVVVLSLAVTVVYLSHIVPFVMAAVSVVFLTVFSRDESRIRSLLLIIAAFMPAFALAAFYRSSVGISESFEPAWRAFGTGSFIEMINQLRSVDPFVLLSRTAFPFADARSMAFTLLAPSLWIAIVIAVLIWPALREFGRIKFVAKVSTGLLLLLAGWTVFAIVGPDDFGITNGGILRDRVMLCSLVFTVPLLKIPTSRGVRTMLTCILAAVVLFQTAGLWEYSANDSDMASRMVYAQSVISDEDSIMTIAVVADGMRFHSVPEPNLGVILGLGRNTAIWDNYELGYTLFPIRANTNADRLFFYQVSISHAFKPHDPKEHFDQTFARLTELLGSDHGRFTKIILIGGDGRIESLLANWFETQPIFSDGNVRVFRSRD